MHGTMEASLRAKRVKVLELALAKLIDSARQVEKIKVIDGVVAVSTLTAVSTILSMNANAAEKVLHKS
jgi:hypothetical protein